MDSWVESLRQSVGNNPLLDVVTPTYAKVIDTLMAQQMKGQAEYGSELIDWAVLVGPEAVLLNALEEACDLAVYLALLPDVPPPNKNVMPIASMQLWALGIATSLADPTWSESFQWKE